ERRWGWARGGIRRPDVPPPHLPPFRRPLHHRDLLLAGVFPVPGGSHTAQSEHRTRIGLAVLDSDFRWDLAHHHDLYDGGVVTEGISLAPNARRWRFWADLWHSLSHWDHRPWIEFNWLHHALGQGFGIHARTPTLTRETVQRRLR